MTRSDDTFIPLAERVRFARGRSAALFISIHADSLPRSEGQAEGATVYTLSENASDAEAARLAEAENKADVIAGVDLTAEPDDVANILVDLAQRETKTFSMQFARTVVGELKTAARLHKHPLKSAGFKVLTAPDVPSVLVELGYMSTKDDLKQLTSAAWRSRTAAGTGAGGRQLLYAPRSPGPAGRAKMGYRPQFQHKTGQPQGRASAIGDDGGGLAVVICQPVLRLTVAAVEACNRAQDGTIRP